MNDIRIAVISDTHGVVKETADKINQLKPIDIVIHLGDFVEDGLEIESHTNIKVIGVKGNCDFSSNLPEDRLITIGEKRLFLTHGHRYDVKWGYQKIFYKGLELEADIILFGHTHVAIHFKEDNILVMNPGSISHPRGHSGKTIGLLEIGKEVRGQIISVE